VRLSGFHMPGRWQSLWRWRYPMGVDGQVLLSLAPQGVTRIYAVKPMPCGCGYCVYDADNQRIGAHRPTLGGAIRQARRHAEQPPL
jgi:hypothetical protein